MNHSEIFTLSVDLLDPLPPFRLKTITLFTKPLTCPTRIPTTFNLDAFYPYINKHLDTDTGTMQNTDPPGGPSGGPPNNKPFSCSRCGSEFGSKKGKTVSHWNYPVLQLR